MPGDKINTHIVFTLPPIPAMEGLTRLRDRIFAVLKEIDAGKRTEPCVVVIDGHAKVGKTFVAEEIRSVLEQMGYPVLLVQPKLCTDGSVVAMGEGEYEESDAKVIIIEELGAYEAAKVLGVDKVDVFAEFTADRLTRYKNLHLAFIRDCEGFEKAIAISMGWYIYPRSLYAEPIGKSMSRYNEFETFDVYLDNSRRHRLTGEEIRRIFSEDAVPDQRLEGKVAIVIDQDEQSYIATKRDLVVNKGFAWQNVKRLYLYADCVSAIEEGNAEMISKAIQWVRNIADGREIVFVINNFKGHGVFFDGLSQLSSLILNQEDLKALEDKEDFIRKITSESAATGTAV